MAINSTEKIISIIKLVFITKIKTIEISMQKISLITSGVVFALLAVSHLIRWLSPVEILINGDSISFVVSFSSGLILALLSIWMFIAVRKMEPNPKK